MAQCPLDDVCYHFPLDDDPEELYLVRVLNPALLWPNEFSAYVTELCRDIDRIRTSDKRPLAEAPTQRQVP